MIIESVEEASKALGILKTTLMQAGKVAGGGAVAGGDGSSLAHDIGSTSSTTEPQSSTSSGSTSSRAVPHLEKPIDIHNPVLDSARTGSALKPDQYHAFNDIIDNYSRYAQKTSLGNADLYQIEGSLNGILGRFEWIIQDSKVTHRLFVPGGKLTGVPIKK